MHGRFADLEHARGVAHGRAIFDDIGGRLKDPLLDVIAQCIVPPSNHLIQRMTRGAAIVQNRLSARYFRFPPRSFGEAVR